jgi:hypothetical protein
MARAKKESIMEKTESSVHSSDLLACPFCGSPAEHESTVTQETIRCTLCPATMSHDGSGAAIKAMWNSRANNALCVKDR